MWMCGVIISDKIFRLNEKKISQLMEIEYLCIYIECDDWFLVLEVKHDQNISSKPFMCLRTINLCTKY